jgi:hypothetical protein
MATKRTKNENERLDDASIERVIKHLEEKGTKKDACAILNISYNTVRLGNILDKYVARKADEAKRRAEKRGKPATPAEITYTIQAYLEGSTVEAISSSLYRSASFVKTILTKYAVPIRQSAHSYFRPELVPEDAMRPTFKVGEKVYSMRYDSLADIRSEFKPGIYCIFLLGEKWQQFAYQPAEELASLEHLKEVGINL